MEEHFRKYSQDLRALQDEKERMIRAGRDVCAAAKRSISAILAGKDPEGALKQVKECFCALGRAFSDDMTKEKLKPLGDGVQELVEAATLAAFLMNGKFLTRDHVIGHLCLCKMGLAETLCNCPLCNVVGASGFVVNGNEKVFGTVSEVVSLSNYVMGVADVGGEVMRHATYAFSAGDFDATKRDCDFLCELRDCLAVVLPKLSYLKSAQQKYDTIVASTEKIESLLAQKQMRDAEKVLLVRTQSQE